MEDKDLSFEENLKQINQNNQEKNNIKSLCDQIKNDITNYQNNKITK